MPGLISDLAVSSNGKFVLVATSPNREVVPGGSRQYMLSLVRDDGKTAWQIEVSSPVKAQDISDDGSWTVISTYDDRITGIDARGQIRWSVDGMCRPYILSRAGGGKLICYHDDDAEPGIAFRVISLDGRSILSYPIANDIVAFKVSPDHKNVVLGLTRGQVILIGSDFRAAWQKRVPGEIVDVAVSSGENPQIIALTSSQQLHALGKRAAVMKLSTPVDQIEFGGENDGLLWTYANSKRGQALGMLRLTGEGFEPEWIRADSRYADLPPIMEAFLGSILIGYEDVVPEGRHHHLLGINARGQATWDAPFAVEENLYLGAKGGDRLAAAALDDGTLIVFRTGD